MLRNITIVLIFIILNVVLLQSNKMNSIKRGAVPQPISAATPDFTWQDLDGKTHNIKELAGHTVVLHFWASWCSPCRREFPELLKAAQSMGDNVIFLTLAGDDTKDPAWEFIQKAEKHAEVKNLKNVIYGLDLDKKIAWDTFQTAVYPETIILDSKQAMHRKYVGEVAWGNPETTEYLKSLP